MTEKQPALGKRGMVITNHPLASAAGAEMLTAGGNAIDAAIVASTQTINSLFGARYIVPGTGMIPNDYMFVFDPRPDRANSIAPGKRVTSSMAPVIATRNGKPAFALGLPGGLRIFPSVMQALSSLIDHGMTVQEAVEAPRVWTQGHALEVEPDISDAVFDALRAMGHDARPCRQHRRRHERDPLPR